MIPGTIPTSLHAMLQSSQNDHHTCRRLRRLASISNFTCLALARRELLLLLLLLDAELLLFVVAAVVVVVLMMVVVVVW
ncbi:hypothetical protein E2C01_088302 [Portunus trituberculatus]|uniref:Transmembrane protein n=1 Tax=Portunus trituberculatus TaxID=210409 RepID=A0A5B7J8V2_PORTR|nr:hypothetical protein [Portunus trituberculatus]